MSQTVVIAVTLLAVMLAFDLADADMSDWTAVLLVAGWAYVAWRGFLQRALSTIRNRLGTIYQDKWLDFAKVIGSVLLASALLFRALRPFLFGDANPRPEPTRTGIRINLDGNLDKLKTNDRMDRCLQEVDAWYRARLVAVETYSARDELKSDRERAVVSCHDKFGTRNP